jgi:hypothetical protein
MKTILEIWLCRHCRAAQYPHIVHSILAYVLSIGIYFYIIFHLELGDKSLSIILSPLIIKYLFFKRQQSTKIIALRTRRKSFCFPLKALFSFRLKKTFQPQKNCQKSILSLTAFCGKKCRFHLETLFMERSTRS